MTPPGSKVSLVVFRDGKQKRITVTIDELTDTLAAADVSEIAKKLGFTVQELTEETSRYYGIRSQEGVIVTKVERGSVADRAEIRPGHIIVSVNQHETDSLRQFNEALKESLKSRKVLLRNFGNRFRNPLRRVL